MANELTLNTSLQYSKGGNVFSKIPSAWKADVAGDHVASGTQNVGTSAENLEKGDITTSGYLLIQNLDSTNFIEVGYDDTGFKPTVKVTAGKFALFQSAQATLQVKADTAACNIAYWLIEA